MFYEAINIKLYIKQDVKHHFKTFKAKLVVNFLIHIKFSNCLLDL